MESENILMHTTYESKPWNLDDLFPGIDSREVQNTLEKIEAQTCKFERFRDQLSPEMDIEDFYEAVILQEELSLQIGKLFQFAYLKFSGNTQNSEASTFMSKIQQIGAEIENRTMFFSLWWKGLDEEEYEKFMMRAGPYEYFLKTIRNFRPYTLTEPQEQVINIKNVTGAAALRSIYGAITSRLTFSLEINGKTETLTQGELLQHVYSPRAEVRAAAYQELLRVYEKEGPILGLIYQNYVRDYFNEHITLRGMKSPIAHRNLANDIPDEIVAKLLDVAQKNTHVFQRFFKLKAKWLVLEKLRRYDIYAPVTTEETKRFAFDNAARMVFAAFQEFEPQFAQLAQKVLDEDHIDSQIRKGKMSGAYSYGVDPCMTPYIHMNYNGKPRDVATLAHELGHSVHSLMARHHTLFNSHASLPLAETASTFAEMLLTDKLLAEDDDDGIRRDILFAQVDDAYATIMRQCFFTMFEIKAHDAINKGASVDEICEIYFETLKEQFGDSLDLTEDYKWEWVYISHFFDRPFYVYAYAFGQLLVLALYQKYKLEGKLFIPRFLEILASGGSMAPMDILDKAGVDVRTAEFWQGGFDVIAGMVEQLEKIPVVQSA